MSHSFYAVFVISLAQGGLASVAQAGPTKDGNITVLGVECARVNELGIDKQENLRASLIRVGCGLEAGGDPDLFPANAGERPSAIDDANVNTITGAEIFPKVTQSESMVWATPDSSTIVVNYNDSEASGGNYSGVSVSVDSGATFTRLRPSPFATGHGTNYGDPIVVYNVALGMWFAGDLATGCGGQGIGLWTSRDGLTWATGACAHNSRSDDRESMWVDNNRNSPYFGRMYVSVNDFASGQRIYVSYSDNGTTWSPAVQVSATFIRNIQLTGSPDDGTVFVAGMDEGTGGLDNRQNIIYRSTDGGVSWTRIDIGARFAPPGVTGCGYFAMIPPLWRHMGWGQPGVGPGGVVHYAYAGRGINAGDIGDIYYTRSRDNGSTWSTPIILNTDAAGGGNRAQWMPSLSVTPDGKVQVTWYDRRNSSNGVNYEYWGIQSPDNGDSWGGDVPISDTLIAQPEQPDSSMVGCYAGDYNYQYSNDTTTFITWTDGRNPVSGHFQQDVYFSSVQQTVSGGLLQGRLTSDLDGSPIAGARVRAVGPVDRLTSTGADGAYRFRLPEGSYDLSTTAFGFLPGSATGVQVIEKMTTTQDLTASPAPSHQLSGTVTSSLTGLPIANAEVRILNTPIPAVRTGDDGVYRFPSVPDGDYNVQAGGSGRCLTLLTQPVTVGPDVVLDVPLPQRSDTFGYTCNDTAPMDWVAAANLSPLVGDDVTLTIPLPFTFNYYGIDYNNVTISTNINVHFGSPNPAFTHVCIPSPSAIQGLVALAWDDGYVGPAPGSGNIYTGVLGDPGSRDFIIEWRGVGYYGGGGTITAEIILHEGTNGITFQYQQTVGRADGRTSTVGIQNIGGTDALQYSCSEAALSVGRRIDFNHP
jgi:hypothetical protein